MEVREEEERWSPGHRVVLGAIMLAGLVVRVAFVAVRQSKVVLSTGDAYWYHYQAKLVADGRGFLHPFDYYKDGITSPGADHPPGLALVLAAADLLGVDSPQGQRYLMCVFGTLTIAVVALLGRRIAGRGVGLIAAGLAALYPNFWINDGMLMTETLFLLAMAGTLLFAYGVLRGGGRRDVLLLSAALAAAAMLRPEVLVLYPTMVLALVLARRAQPWRERWIRVALAAVVPIVAFAPWALYNQTRFDEPVPISTGSGQTLAVGNCDLTYSGDFLGFYNTLCLLPPEIDPPTAPDRSVRDGEYRALAQDYIRDHVGDLPKVAAARVGRLWHLYRVDQGLRLDGWIEGRSGGPPGSTLWPVRTAVYSYYGLAVLAIAGGVLLRRRRIPQWPLLAQVALATFTAATTFGVTRYRAGAEITLVLLAAVALRAIGGALAARRRPTGVPG